MLRPFRGPELNVPKFWAVGMAAALALIAIGVALGEPAQVLLNAASVCLACMGVG